MNLRVGSFVDLLANHSGGDRCRVGILLDDVKVIDGVLRHFLQTAVLSHLSSTGASLD